MKLEEILKNNNVVNSWENRPQAFTGQKVDTATFIGPNSESWQPMDYQEALELEKQGMSPEDIWRKTGTGRGLDRKWRQEISDYDAYLTDTNLFAEDYRYEGSNGETRSPLARNPNIINEDTGRNAFYNGGQLKDGLDHPELYKAYPGMEHSSLYTYEPEDFENSLGINLALPYGPEEFGPELKQKYPKSGLDELNIDYTGSTNASGFTDRQSVDRQNFLTDNTGHLTGLTQRLDNMSIPNTGILKGQDDIFSTLLHENQHSIQGLEGWFANIGGNGNWEDFFRRNADTMVKAQEGLYWPDDEGYNTVPFSNLDQETKDMIAYYYQPSEAESRVTQSRMNLTAPERRDRFPFEQNDEHGYDIDPSIASSLLEAYNNK
jgi:hypothetical protein